MKRTLLLAFFVACSASEPVTALESAICASGTPGVVPVWDDTGELTASYITQETAQQQIAIPQRVVISSDLSDPPGGATDPTLTVITRGVSLTHHDGGIQSFNDSTYDCSVDTTYQSFAIAAFNEARCDGEGPGRMQPTGVFSNSSPDGYSWLSHTGAMRNDGPVSLGASLTVGPGAAADVGEAVFHADLLVDNVQRVELGNNVGSFKVPTGQIGLGYSGGMQGQLAMRNTGGASVAGMEIHADTSSLAHSSGSISFHRGPGGAGEVAGVSLVGQANAYVLGALANDLAIWNYDPASAGRRLVFATGAGPTARLTIDNAGLSRVLAGLSHYGPLGFYGATPIAKQTNVPRTCEGVWDALSNLGLIE